MYHVVGTIQCTDIVGRKELQDHTVSATEHAHCRSQQTQTNNEAAKLYVSLQQNMCLIVWASLTPGVVLELSLELSWQLRAK